MLIQSKILNLNNHQTSVRKNYDFVKQLKKKSLLKDEMKKINKIKETHKIAITPILHLTFK